MRGSQPCIRDGTEPRPRLLRAGARSSLTERLLASRKARPGPRNRHDGAPQGERRSEALAHKERCCARRRSIPPRRRGEDDHLAQHTAVRTVALAHPADLLTTHRKDFPMNQRNMNQTNMDLTNAYPHLHLAVARLMDAIESQPLDRAEFDAAKAQSLQSAHAALVSKPARRTHRDWLSAAARLGRALGAGGRKDHALRLAADFLNLPRLCERSRCQRAQRCSGAARACLNHSAPRVPECVRASMAALCERIERGDQPELAVALMPFESKAALWAWWKVVTSDSHKSSKARHARHSGPAFGRPKCKPCAGHPRLSGLSARKA